MPRSRGRVAFVPTRYGRDFAGGSESVMREAAHGFAARGWEVEVLTTCARDHYTWANAYEAGSTKDGDVTVRRFPTVHDGDRFNRDHIERRIQLGLPVSPDEERTWLNGNFRVPDLFHHLVGTARTFDAIVFSPYLFWTTVVCSVIEPERSIVMPCLHDEYYAYLELFRPLLGGVGQLWFLSDPEHQLAHRLAPLAPHRLTGAGVHPPDDYDPDGFRARFGIKRPFVLFSGRRESGKGWDDLLHAFRLAVVEFGVDLDLVTTGVREIDVPSDISERVIDLGFVSERDLADAFAAASAYIQPSKNESFSRTIMEAWLAGTLVVANSASDVVRWHCERSGAGLTYDDHHELVQCLAFVAEEPHAADRLAAGGRDYVLKEYAPETVLDRMEEGVEELRS